MKRCILVVWAALLFPVWILAQQSFTGAFTLEEVLRAPFAENLTAAKKVNRAAWTLDEEGKRNVWVAEGPGFQARRLTSYLEDDGQEISELSFSEDGNSLVYVRGGEKNPAGQYPNPTSNPAGVTQTVWVVAWTGGEARKVDAGHSPKISTRGTLAYLRDAQIWLAPLDGSDKPVQLVVRGQNHSEQWSPDGARLAFVSSRGDHSFIGVYDVASKSVSFLSPSVDTDSDPHRPSTASASPSSAAPPSLATRRKAFLSSPTNRILGRLDRRRSDTQRSRIWHSSVSRRDRFPTWPMTPAAAS